MKDTLYIDTNNAFITWCIEKGFSKEEARDIYTVYFRILKVIVKKFNKDIDFLEEGDYKHRHLTSKEKKEQIEVLLKKRGKDVFLKAIRKTILNNENKTLTKNLKTPTAFSNFVINFKEDYSMERPSIFPTEIVIKKGCIPIRNKKIFPSKEYPDAIYEGDREWLAYNYICSECNALIENIWVSTCKCGEIIKWEFRDKIK
jgi:hypothetical protein